jgi:hypothetical protein
MRGRIDRPRLAETPARGERLLPLVSRIAIRTGRSHPSRALRFVFRPVVT